MKIDKEYSCTWFKEVNFLSKNGIRYSFVKENDGLTTWKYKKTEQLFRLLAEFYKLEEVRWYVGEKIKI